MNDSPQDDFFRKLASSSPTPGGGAAAARSGLHAAGLLRMVAAITLERGKPDEDLRAELESAFARALELADRFTSLEREDMAAFEGFLDAMRLPKSTDDEKLSRKSAMRAAAKRATEAPIATMECAAGVLGLASELASLAERLRLRAEANVGSALELATGAFRAAEWNVRVNLPSLGDERAGYEARHAKLAEDFDSRYKALKATIAGWF